MPVCTGTGRGRLADRPTTSAWPTLRRGTRCWSRREVCLAHAVIKCLAAKDGSGLKNNNGRPRGRSLVRQGSQPAAQKRANNSQPRDFEFHMKLQSGDPVAGDFQGFCQNCVLVPTYRDIERISGLPFEVWGVTESKSATNTLIGRAFPAVPSISYPHRICYQTIQVELLLEGYLHPINSDSQFSELLCAVRKYHRG